jgi:hypothetical protein
VKVGPKRQGAMQPVKNVNDSEAVRAPIRTDLIRLVQQDSTIPRFHILLLRHDCV